MAKRTLRKPKKSKTSLAKKIQRKTRSKRLRSRGRRMSDKALSRSRLKQKKSKRRGKILRGSGKQKSAPARLGPNEERVPASLRTLQGVRKQRKAAAASSGRRKVQSSIPKIAAQSGAEQIAQAAAFALLNSRELRRKTALQKAERAAAARNFGDFLDVKAQLAEAEQQLVDEEIAEIEKSFAESDRIEEGPISGELPRMLRDGQRAIGAPAARAAASAINDPRSALYYAAGQLLKVGDQLVMAGDGTLGPAGPTNMAVSAAAAVRAGQMAAAAGHQMAQQMAQQALATGAEALEGLVESLNRASSDMGSGDYESFAGKDYQKMRGE